MFELAIGLIVAVIIFLGIKQEQEIKRLWNIIYALEAKIIKMSIPSSENEDK